MPNAASPPLTIQGALDRYGMIVGQAKRSQHLAIVRRYLLWGGTNTDAKLAEYAQYLSSAGYKGSTIDLHLRIIRAFWRALGLTVPRIPDGITVESERIALGTEQVHWLISQARQHCRPRDQALLVLSTVYGLRAAELASLRRQDIRLADSRIFIRTAKGGIQRWQYLPESLHSYVDVIWPRTTANRLAKSWHDIIDQIQCPMPSGVGWHSVRRALARDLDQAGVAEPDITTFMRWSVGKQSGKQSMVKLYANPTAEITSRGIVQHVAQDMGAQEADWAVWKHHPYLGDWE